jgi:hypothetical protein
MEQIAVAVIVNRTKTSQGEDLPKVRPEISPGGEHGRGIKEGRKKQIKDQLRIEANLRKAGDQSEDHTADGQQDWIGDPDFPGNDRQQSDGNKTNQN